MMRIRIRAYSAEDNGIFLPRVSFHSHLYLQMVELTAARMSLMPRNCFYSHLYRQKVELPAARMRLMPRNCFHSHLYRRWSCLLRQDCDKYWMIVCTFTCTGKRSSLQRRKCAWCSVIVSTLTCTGRWSCMLRRGCAWCRVIVSSLTCTGRWSCLLRRGCAWCRVYCPCTLPAVPPAPVRPDLEKTIKNKYPSQELWQTISLEESNSQKGKKEPRTCCLYFIS